MRSVVVAVVVETERVGGGGGGGVGVGGGSILLDVLQRNWHVTQSLIQLHFVLLFF